jgi:hypothetical protein
VSAVGPNTAVDIHVKFALCGGITSVTCPIAETEVTLLSVQGLNFNRLCLAPSGGSGGSMVGIAVGVVVALLVVIGASVGGLFFVMKKHKLKLKDLSFATVVTVVKGDSDIKGEKVKGGKAVELVSTMKSENGSIAVVTTSGKVRT